MKVVTLLNEFSVPARANPPSPPFTKGGRGGILNLPTDMSIY